MHIIKYVPKNLYYLKLTNNLLGFKRHPGLAYIYVFIYGQNLEKAMATHSSTFAWKIAQMEEPGGLQSMGSLRVGHD